MWWIGLIVGIGAVALVVGVVAYEIVKRKKGKGGCGGCCSSCGVDCPLSGRKDDDGSAQKPDENPPES